MFGRKKKDCHNCGRCADYNPLINVENCDKWFEESPGLAALRMPYEEIHEALNGNRFLDDK